MLNLTIDHSFIHQLMKLSPCPMALVCPASESLLSWNYHFVKFCAVEPQAGTTLEMLGLPKNILSFISSRSQPKAKLDPPTTSDGQQAAPASEAFEPHAGQANLDWVPLPNLAWPGVRRVMAALAPLPAPSGYALLYLRPCGAWEYTDLLRRGDLLFNTMPGMWALQDMFGNCLECNQAFCDYVGLPRKDVLGRRFLHLLNPDEMEESESLFVRCVAEKSRQTMITHSRRNQRELMHEMTFLPLPRGRADDDELEAVLAFVVDIGAKIPLERTLSRRDALMRATSQLAEIFLSTELDLDKTMNAALALLGSAARVDRVTVWHFHANANLPATAEPDSQADRPRDHMTRLYAWSAALEPQRDPVHRLNLPVVNLVPSWQEVLKRGETVNKLIRDLPPKERDELQVWGIVSILAAPIIVNDELWGFIGFDDWKDEHIWSEPENSVLSTAANIIGLALHRRAVKEALLESQARFQAVEEATGEAIWSLDENFCHSYVSERALPITGYRPDELLGKPWNALLVYKGRPAHPRPGDAPVRDMERRIICKDGRRKWLRSAYKYMFDEQGKFRGVLGTSLDITEVREAQEEARRGRKALEKSNVQLAAALDEARQLAEQAKQAARAKSEFLANMSHEVRTPINAIMGMARLLGRTPLNGGQQEYLDNINLASRALLAVVNDILDFSSLEDGDFVLDSSPFRVSDVVEGVGFILRGRAEKAGLSLKSVIDPAVAGRYRGDPMRLTQVLMNLGTNAIKFSPHGKITISAGLPESGAPGLLHFTVCDEGIGIEPEKQSLLFSPFQQADSSFTRRYEGTGLGLAISKKLVERMGGQIWCESTLGRGSTFHFTISLEQLETAAIREEEWSAESFAARFGGRKILLVEDNELNRLVASDLLSQAGLLVREAENGLQALAALKKEHFDLVLMDIQMPEMDGLTASRKIRAQPGFADLPIVALTAHALGADKQKSLEAGMDGHLTKPIDVAELYRTLAKWLEVKTCHGKVACQ